MDSFTFARHLPWLLITLLAAGCGDDDGVAEMDAGAEVDAGARDDDGGAGDDAGPEGDAGPPVDTGPPVDAGPRDDVFATNPSRGAPVAISEDGTTLAAANAETDDVTFFDRDTLEERARVSVGGEPTVAVFSPDGDTLFVVNRADGTVSEIGGASGDSPSVRETHDLGGELVGAAMSPGGSTLYVSDWTGARLHLVDTSDGSATEVALGGAPYAVCVTNDGDEDETDETVYVTDFYARPVDGVREAEDGSRQGRVFHLDAAGTLGGEIILSPIDVTGIEEGIDAADTSAFPNQLYACAINDEHLYVTSVGASPAPFEGGTDFRQNVHGLMHAVTLESNEEDAARTVNLSELVAALDAPKRFTAVPSSVAFVPGTEFAYIASLTSDSVLRVSFETLPAEAGSPSGDSFLAAGQGPMGIAIFGTNAYTYDELGRSVTHIDLASQTTVETVESAPEPSGAAEEEEHLGKRFFTTGLARWSTGAWVACVACHPGGTTDNVTWVFPAGPRQTVDTSATFDVSGSHQRILNWTAIFDEVHDFELNTRAVANGVGAIVSDAELDVANRIDFVGPGMAGDPENAFNVGSARAVALSGAKPEDWDAIEAYVRSIRTPNAVAGEGDPVAGREVFEDARCQNCHGGPLWTLSERYYTPILDGDLRTLTLEEAGIDDVGDVRPDQLRTTDTSAMNVLENDANGPPQRHSCVVRDVGTFDADGPDARGANELRQNGNLAQGVDGFNVPSLLNAGLGAPYLHHGAAETLEDLLDPEGEFLEHLRAGNQVLALSETQLRDLIAFVRSIDDDTPTFDIPAGQTFCPEGVVPPVAD